MRHLVNIEPEHRWPNEPCQFCDNGGAVFVEYLPAHTELRQVGLLICSSEECCSKAVQEMTQPGGWPAFEHGLLRSAPVNVRHLT